MRRAIASLLLVALSAPVLAQVGESRTDLAVGVSGGYVLNKVSFTPTIKQLYHGGTTFGLTARYTCEKYFAAICAFQIEANFAQMGWREKIETSNDTYQRTMNYVQIPLLANLGFGRERKGVKGFLALGPQIGFCLNEEDKRTGEWSDKTLYDRPNHVIEQYDMAVENTFEYGLTGGVGMDICTKHGHHFLLEGRYFYALSDIFHNSKKDTFGRSANGAISAKISYLFDIKKTKR